MSDEVRIRVATLEDTNAIAKVFIASRDTLIFLPMLHTDQETFDFIANKVLREQEVLVAERDGRIVGFVAMAHGDFLEHMYVDPDSQGRGVGSARAREGANAQWVPPLGVSAEQARAALLQASRVIELEGRRKGGCSAPHAVDPVSIPHDIEKRGVITGTDPDPNPQLNGLIPLPPQVTGSAQLNLSRWRHGFEPRWDYDAKHADHGPSSGRRSPRIRRLHPD